MKAVLLTGIRRMEIADVAIPAIKRPTDVLLRIRWVGVCGSDVHYYETGRIGDQRVKYPFIIGHECSAVVEDVGRAVKTIKPGDEVAIEPAVPCHRCDQCRAGRENTCRNLSFLGTPGQGRGCMCEYIVMPEENCLPTMGKISLEDAVVCEPFAIGLYSVKQAQVSKGDKIAILGSGPIGLSCLLAAKLFKAKSVYMTDRIKHRQAVAEKAGAAWTGNPDMIDIVKAIIRKEPLGLDAVFECAGQQSTLDEAVRLLRPGGALAVVGIPRFKRVGFDIDNIRRKEITIINIRRQNRCSREAVELAGSRKVDLGFMITHKSEMRQAREVFELVSSYRDGVIKAVIKF